MKRRISQPTEATRQTGRFRFLRLGFGATVAVLVALAVLSVGRVKCAPEPATQPSASGTTSVGSGAPGQGAPDQDAAKQAPPDGSDPGAMPPGGPGGPPPDGAGPGGPPPDGAGGPGGPGGPPPGGGGNKAYTLSGVYTLSDGSTKNVTDQRVDSSKTDVSGVYVSKGSSLTLVNPTITTSGDTSSNDNSSFHGLNAAVLAVDGSKVAISGGSIATSGAGANGLFAAGSGAVATMTGGTITAKGRGGHGVMATKGGTVLLTNVDITTMQERGAPIATDRGSGTIIVKGGTTHSAGMGSPALYSTGKITVSDATMVSTGAEGAVIEGANSITLHNCSLTGDKLDGAMIYQSFSGDAVGQKGVFTMDGGSLAAKTGPLFFVTNTNATIRLSGVKLSASSGVLVKASTGRWGRTGHNGGIANLTADGETLNGDLISDASSSISATLKNKTVLSGTVTGASLTLDATSTWNVTGDSVLTSLTLADTTNGSIAGITSNGHKVTYNASLEANKWLGGKTYTLPGGGMLAPK